MTYRPAWYPQTRQQADRGRLFLAAGRLCAEWVYSHAGGAPWLNQGKMGRMQAASGNGLSGRSAGLAGRVWRDGE